MAKKKEDIDSKYFGEEMSCAVCTTCYSMPYNRKFCVYGGPFIGYKTREGLVTTKHDFVDKNKESD